MKKVLFIALLCVLIAAPAFADLYGQVDAKYTSMGPHQTLTIWSSKHTSGVSGVGAGIYMLDLKNATGGAASYGDWLNGSTAAFCIDLYEYVPAAEYETYDVKSLDATPNPNGPMGVEKAGYLATLFDKYWKDSLTDQEARNLQLAVWEIIDEELGTSWSVADGAGNFYVNDAAIADEVDAMLASVELAGQSSFTSYLGLSNPVADGTGDGYQDFVVKVPVPGAALLGFLGLGAAGLKLRKRV